jgi:hypothetical protein
MIDCDFAGGLSAAGVQQQDCLMGTNCSPDLSLDELLEGLDESDLDLSGFDLPEWSVVGSQASIGGSAPDHGVIANNILQRVQPQQLPVVPSLAAGSNAGCAGGGAVPVVAPPGGFLDAGLAAGRALACGGHIGAQRSWAITAPAAATNGGLHTEPPLQQLQQMSMFDVNARLSCPPGATLPFQQPLLPGLHVQRRLQDVDSGRPAGVVFDPVLAGAAAFAGSAPMVGGMAGVQQACMGGVGLVGGAGQVPAAAFSSVAAASGPFLSNGALGAFSTSLMGGRDGMQQPCVGAGVPVGGGGSVPYGSGTHVPADLPVSSQPMHASFAQLGLGGCPTPSGHTVPLSLPQQLQHTADAQSGVHVSGSGGGVGGGSSNTAAVVEQLMESFVGYDIISSRVRAKWSLPAHVLALP